jgi:hypothetical protein
LTHREINGSSQWQPAREWGRWLLIALAGLLAGAAAPPARTEIWLAGVDPFVRQAMRPGEASDYLELFDDAAPWPRAAQHVQVFKTSTQYLLNAPDEALRKMFAGLRRRGIALAFEGLMQPRHDACGQGVEGYSAPGAIGAAAARVRRLGGTIAAVAMDEPLWFGHHAQGPHTCAASIDAVARGVAENVAALRAVFPAARVGDIEPLDPTAPDAWADEIARFGAAFQAASGTPLDFVHADVDWNGPWRPALAALARRLRADRIAYGVIYNGDPQDDFDESWTGHATARFETVEAEPDLAPNQAILQTWMVHPLHMLPETVPGTMTGLVLSYVRPATHLTLRVAGGVIGGQLTGADGQPIAGARILLTARDSAPVPRPTSRHLSGLVPAGAARALLALRLNTECGCAGPASVRIGAGTWHADGAEVTVGVTQGPPPDEAAFRADAGEKLTANGGAFAVVPGAAFALTVPLGAAPGADQAGYLALIFLDAAGKEVQRRKLALTPGELAVESDTDAGGEFTVARPPNPAWADWRGVFAGNAAWRGTAAAPPATAP